MFLIGIRPIRIKEHKKGYVVEIERRKWYGIKYWTHAISVAGIASEPWYFLNFEIAEKEACKMFKWELWHNTQYTQI